MKFFHLSDLHIGLRLYNRDLLEDQACVLREIADLAAREQPDAVLIAGDIYDRAVPSAEAVEVFDRFLSELTSAVPDAAVMAISGNHDSAPRINCYRGILARQNLYMVGQPPQHPEDHIEKVTLRDEYGPVHFWLLPFVRPSMVRALVGDHPDTGENNDPPARPGSEVRGMPAGSAGEAQDTAEAGIAGDAPASAPRTALTYEEAVRRLLAREEIDTAERNILVSHQFYLPAGRAAEEVERMDSEVRTVGNIDAVSAQVLAPFDYAALGHIHKPMKVGSERIRYCGTPAQYSVSEAGQRKGILAVELGEKPAPGAGAAASRSGEEGLLQEGCGPRSEAGEASPKAGISVRVLPLHAPHEVRVLRGSLEEVLGQSCEDYVSAVLTDRIDLDVLDMQDRLRAAFPNLLEIRREAGRAAEYTRAASPRTETDPFALCCSFLGDPDEGERSLLREVIQSVQMKDTQPASSAERLWEQT